MPEISARCTWMFGTYPDINAPDGTKKKHNNVLGSTGAGATFNTHGWGLQYSFYAEADAAATGSYQIRTARTSSGPWAVVSSGTLSTSQADIIQLPGPFAWLSPRVKTLNSTANTIIIRMTAVD